MLALFLSGLGILIIGGNKFSRLIGRAQARPFPLPIRTMTDLLSNPLNPGCPMQAFLWLEWDCGLFPVTLAIDLFTRANPSPAPMNESMAFVTQLTIFQSSDPFASASDSMTPAIDASTLASQLTPFERNARYSVDPLLLTAAESITVPQCQGEGVPCHPSQSASLASSTSAQPTNRAQKTKEGNTRLTVLKQPCRMKYLPDTLGGGGWGRASVFKPHSSPYRPGHERRRARYLLAVQCQPPKRSAGTSGAMNIPISPILNQNTATCPENTRSVLFIGGLAAADQVSFVGVRPLRQGRAAALNSRCLHWMA